MQILLDNPISTMIQETMRSGNHHTNHKGEVMSNKIYKPKCRECKTNSLIFVLADEGQPEGWYCEECGLFWTQREVQYCINGCGILVDDGDNDYYCAGCLESAIHG